MAMTSQSTLPLRAEFAANPAVAFAAAMLALVAAAAVFAGWFPLGFSIAIVFLFAGPHNWLEARYFMTRMPARWGRLRGFFTLGIAGVVGLTVGMVALPTLAAALGDAPETWRLLLATWNSALVFWAATLATIRRGQNPRRQWPWLWPAAFGLITLAWLWPVGWGIGLVYLHPLVAIAFFDAEIGRRRPDLQATWRWCLLAVPVAIVALAWRLGDAADLTGSDVLTAQITRHAGGGVVPRVSTHFLVAAHTFLEMLHYGIWCVAMPLLAVGATPWRLAGVPLARRSAGWRAALTALLVVGGLVVAALWAGFMIDYPLTRSVYFTMALVHVLAEVPFLVREA